MDKPLHNRDEYVEQAYFFRTYRERLDANLPAQEILRGISQELLTTTKLPMVLEFLTSEMMLHGKISGGMKQLPHYFTPFQTFVISQSEKDRTKFDFRVALMILEKEAEFLGQENASQQGLFIYQFECISRNRLGYQDGLQAMALDPMYNQDWKSWVSMIRQSLGAVEFSEMIYSRSQYRVEEVRRRTDHPDYKPSYPVLFGTQEGRIAKANQGREPLYMFMALQRHLGYPKVPRPRPPRSELFDPVLEQRFAQLEARMRILEAESTGKLDLSEFYYKPEDGPPKFKD